MEFISSDKPVSPAVSTKYMEQKTSMNTNMNKLSSDVEFISSDKQCPLWNLYPSDKQCPNIWNRMPAELCSSKYMEQKTSMNETTIHTNIELIIMWNIYLQINSASCRFFQIYGTEN